MQRILVRAILPLLVIGASAAVLSASGALGVYRGVGSSLAATRNEIEPNNDTTNANTIAFGDTVLGELNAFQNFDWFEVELSEGTWIDLRTTRGYINFIDWNPASWIASDSRFTLRIGATGKYYIGIHHDDPSVPDPANLGPYTLTVAAPPAHWLHESEPNDNVATATPIAIGDTVLGVFSAVTDVDEYTIELEANTLVTLGLSAGAGFRAGGFVGLTLTGPNGQVVPSAGSSNGFWVGTSGSYSLRMHDTQGTVNGWHSYKLRPTVLHRAEDLESESNDDPSAADPLTLGDTLYGAIGVAGDVDHFAVELTRGSWITFALGSLSTALAPAAAVTLDGADVPIDGSFQVVTTGRHIVRVTNANGSGSPSHAYYITFSERNLGAGWFSHVEDGNDTEVIPVPLGDTAVAATINPALDRDRFSIDAPDGYGVAVEPKYVPNPNFPYGMKMGVTCSGVDSSHCVVELRYDWPPSPTPPNPFVGHDYDFRVFRYPLDPERALQHLLQGGTLTAEHERGLDLSGNRSGAFDIGDVRRLMGID